MGCRSIDVNLQSEDVEGGGCLSQTFGNEMGFVLCGDQLIMTSGAVEDVAQEGGPWVLCSEPWLVCGAHPHTAGQLD